MKKKVILHINNFQYPTFLTNPVLNKRGKPKKVATMSEIWEVRNQRQKELGERFKKYRPQHPD